MITRMTHPEHGAHDAYSSADVEACKAKGWIVAEEKLPEVKVNIDEPIVKRGRPFNKVNEEE